MLFLEKNDSERLRMRTARNMWTLPLTLANMLAWGHAAMAEETAPAAFVEPMRVEKQIELLHTPARVLKQKLTLLAPGDAAQVTLGPWRNAQARSLEPSPPSGMLQIGASRLSSTTQTAQSLGSLLYWQRSAQGGWVSAVSIRSEAAYDIRLGVLVDQLPGSAILRVYSQQARDSVFEIAGQQILQLLQSNRDAGDLSDEGRTWWAPSTGTEEATLEVELPPGTPVEHLRIAIPRVVHVYRDMLQPSEHNAQMRMSAKINESGYCHLDSNCYAQNSDEKNSIARMNFVENGLSYVCTGTLLNSKDGKGIPYFLTANHCIDRQTVASSLETTWFYRSASCGSRYLSTGHRVLQGGRPCCVL